MFSVIITVAFIVAMSIHDANRARRRAALKVKCGGRYRVYDYPPKAIEKLRRRGLPTDEMLPTRAARRRKRTIQEVICALYCDDYSALEVRAATKAAAFHIRGELSFDELYAAALQSLRERTNQ